MNLLRKLGPAFDWLIDSLAYLAGGIFFFVMVAVTVDVSRKLFGIPIQWFYDVSGYLLLYTSFLGAAWLLKKK